jgi:putative membrane protein
MPPGHSPDKNPEAKMNKMTFLAGLLIICFACNNEQKNSDDPKDIAEEHNDAKFDRDKEKDAQFMVDAADMSLRQIKNGKLAKDQAMAEDIRDLGKTMAADHEKILADLQKLASTKMITLPTEVADDGTQSYDKLSSKGGNDFDKAYCDQLVDDHKDAVEKYTKASTDAEDYEIKSWAGKQLPVLQAQLDKSMSCQEKYKDGASTGKPAPVTKTEKPHENVKLNDTYNKKATEKDAPAKKDK